MVLRRQREAAAMRGTAVIFFAFFSGCGLDTAGRHAGRDGGSIACRGRNGDGRLGRGTTSTNPIPSGVVCP